QRLPVGAVVVEDDDLVAGVARLLLDAPQALPEQRPAVAGRNDDGHERGGGELIADGVQTGRTGLHPRLATAPPHSLLDRPPPRAGGGGVGRRGRGPRGGGCAASGPAPWAGGRSGGRAG